VQVETDRFIQVWLLGKVPVHAMIGDLCAITGGEKRCSS
jgi:hypothetical protein